MADNYLERRMEDYRAGCPTPGAHVRPVAKDTPQRVPLRLTPCMVFIDDCGYAPLIDAVVRAYREAGCKVAFTMADRRAGNALAQSCGAQFYPAGTTDRLPQCIDITLDATLRLTVRRGGRTAVNALRPGAGASAGDIAAVCLMLGADSMCAVNGNDIHIG